MKAAVLILKITLWFSVSVAECINVLSCCCVCRCWQWIWRKMASSHTWGKPPKSLGLPIAWRKPYVSEWGSEGMEDYPNLDQPWHGRKQWCQGPSSPVRMTASQLAGCRCLLWLITQKSGDYGNDSPAFLPFVTAVMEQCCCIWCCVHQLF